MPLKKADGIVKKYALIINGDNEARHLGNVDRAISALRAEDSSFRVSVVSPVAPKNQVDHYLTPLDANIKRAVAGLKSKMDADDVFVVYLTGHGGEGEKNQGCVDMPESCYELPQLQKDLSTLKWGKRTVVMDQCNGGSGAKLFYEPKTTVISEGGVGEEVSCGLFAPYFWSNKVTDSNRDGVVSVQERFAYALRQGETKTNAQFLTTSSSASLTGVPSKKATFPMKVSEVSTESELRQQLAQLKPGQLALVDFSAHWCGPCKAYYPEFQQLAKTYGGSFLLIHAQAKKGDRVGEDHWNLFNVDHYPTVAFIDSSGQIFQVNQRMIADPARELNNLVGELENFQIESDPREMPYTKTLQSMISTGIVPADTIQLFIDVVSSDDVTDVAESLQKILLIPQRLVAREQRQMLLQALQETYDAFPEALGVQATILEILVAYQIRAHEFDTEFLKKVEKSIAEMRLAYEQGKLPKGQYWLQFAGRALLFLLQTGSSESELLWQTLAKDMAAINEAGGLLDKYRHETSVETYARAKLALFREMVANGNDKLFFDDRLFAQRDELSSWNAPEKTALLKIVFDLTKKSATKVEAFKKLHWLQERNVADVMDIQELRLELMAMLNASGDEAVQSHIERLALVHEFAQNDALTNVSFDSAFATLAEQLIHGDAAQRFAAYQQLSVLQCMSATNYYDDMAIERSLFDSLKFEHDALVRAKMVYVAKLFEHDIPRENAYYLDRTASLNSLQANFGLSEVGLGFWYYPLGLLSYGLQLRTSPLNLDSAAVAGARISLLPNDEYLMSNMGDVGVSDAWHVALSALIGASYAESTEPLAELEFDVLLPELISSNKAGIRPVIGLRPVQFTAEGVHVFFSIHFGLEILLGENKASF